jgi:hypothetical protein
VFAVLKFTDDSGATVSSDDVSSGFSTEFSESSDDGSATAQEDAVTTSAMEVLATLDSGNNHSPTVEGLLLFITLDSTKSFMHQNGLRPSGSWTDCRSRCIEQLGLAHFSPHF